MLYWKSCQLWTSHDMSPPFLWGSYSELWKEASNEARTLWWLFLMTSIIKTHYEWKNKYFKAADILQLISHPTQDSLPLELGWEKGVISQINWQLPLVPSGLFLPSWGIFPFKTLVHSLKSCKICLAETEARDRRMLPGHTKQLGPNEHLWTPCWCSQSICPVHRASFLSPQSQTSYLQRCLICLSQNALPDSSIRSFSLPDPFSLHHNTTELCNAESTTCI